MDLGNYNQYTLSDIFDNLSQADKLYKLGKYSDAYQIISNFSQTFDVFAQINLTSPKFGLNEYKAFYLLAGNICAELGTLPYHSHLIWNFRGWASFLGGLVAWRRFSKRWLLGLVLLFCGFLNMVTFDGDVGIVFVEAYNYLSDLSILV